MSLQTVISRWQQDSISVPSSQRRHPEHRSKADRSETPAHYFNAIAVSITLSAFRWFLPNAGCECSFCVKAVKRLFYPDGVAATKIVPEARYQMWKAEDGWVKK